MGQSAAAIDVSGLHFRRAEAEPRRPAQAGSVFCTNCL